MEKWYCTRCDKPSQSAVRARDWRCPHCDCAHRSRNDRAAVKGYCLQWRAFARSLAKKQFSLYPTVVTAKVGGIDDLTSVALMGLLRAAYGYVDRGFTFGSYAHKVIWGEMRRAMESKTTWTVSLSAMTGDEGQEVEFPDPASAEAVDVAAKAEEIEAVQSAISKLRPRDGAIIAGRIRGQSFGTVGKAFGISPERTRQIEQKAMAKLAGMLAHVA